MKICLFSSYFQKEYVPPYVLFYIDMLLPYFDRVYLITNKRSLKNADALSLRLVPCVEVENYGFDFGMYYTFAENNIEIFREVSELALVNDSCICFKDLRGIFDFIKESRADVCGVTDSIEVDYHLQSYFLYFKTQKSIKLLLTYFKECGIMEDYTNVVRRYEIGLSKKLTLEGLTLDSLFSYMDHLDYEKDNPILYYAKELIEMGCPLIKKKLLLSSFKTYEKYFLKSKGFDFSFDYLSLLNRYQDTETLEKVFNP